MPILAAHSRRNYLIAIALLSILAGGCANKKSEVKTKPPLANGKKWAVDSFKVRELTDVVFEKTDKRLERGKYLATGILQCFTCHSPRDWNTPGAPPIEGKEGSGGTILREDSLTRIIAPNITPDKETGAGNWTDDMLARAIREGVGHDGRALYWEMPYSTFRNLTDEDLASVVVFLKSIPAVRNVVLPTKLTAQLKSDLEKNLYPLTDTVPEINWADSFKRGKYLVAIGECFGCHTSHASFSPGVGGGGNDITRFNRKAFSANITADSTGIGYGVNGFIFAIRTGKGGLLSPIMPWISDRNINDEDLRAIYGYLSKMPLFNHAVNNLDTASFCAVCEYKHGAGWKNKRIRPLGIKMDPSLYDQYAGSYFCERYGLTYTVKREGKKLVGTMWENAPKVELIPQSETHFLAPGWFLPVTFIKDKDGKVTGMQEDSDIGSAFTKIK